VSCHEKMHDIDMDGDGKSMGFVKALLSLICWI
jgi:hypothetical protein